MVRWATEADFRALYGDEKAPTCRAVAAARGGETLGLMGWKPDAGGLYVFSRIKPGFPKVGMWRAAVAALAMMGRPAWCVAEAGSAPFLRRLGWRSVGFCDLGEVFEWRTS